MENFLDVYLRTPDLPKHDQAKALLARGKARKAAGEMLLAKAQQGMLQLKMAFASVHLCDSKASPACHVF